MTDLGLSLSTQGLSLAPGCGLPDGHFGILRLEIQNGNHFGEMVTRGLHFWRVQSLHPWAYGCQEQGQELEIGSLLSSFSSTSSSPPSSHF